MKRIVLFVIVLLVIASCSKDYRPTQTEVFTYQRADDAIFLLISTNSDTRVIGVGNGRARVIGNIFGSGDGAAIRMIHFTPDDIVELLSSTNIRYSALGTILNAYAKDDKEKKK